MGPVASLAIAAVLFLLVKTAGQPAPFDQLNSWTAASFLQRLMIANIALAAFNLLPAFPMDGGRILRALMARYFGFTRATRAAARIGHGIAFLFGVLGLFTNPFLLFIAFFVWIGASQEAAVAEVKSALAGVPVSRVTVTDLTPIATSDPLSRAVELVLHGTQQDFPVLEDGRLAGILTQKELLQGLSEHGPEAEVSAVMLRDFPTVAKSDSLQSAFDQLQSTGRRVLPVVNEERLIGLLTMENLAEFVMFQSALSRNGNVPMVHRGGTVRRRGDQEHWPKLIA